MAESRKRTRGITDADTTIESVRVPVVLVVGGPDALIEAARSVAGVESGLILVESCSAMNVATAATQRRPFALVISQDIFAFDPEEFAALARDVQADLVVLKVAGVSGGFLEQALRPSLRVAFRKFRTETESGPVRK